MNRPHSFENPQFYIGFRYYRLLDKAHLKKFSNKDVYFLYLEGKKGLPMETFEFYFFEVRKNKNYS